MPAKKNEALSEKLVGLQQFADEVNATTLATEHPEWLDLIQWVGRTIVTRNANGRQSDKFCALCQKSKLHKEPCRHAAIWRLAGINK
jgi:hypothetical protein